MSRRPTTTTTTTVPTLGRDDLLRVARQWRREIGYLEAAARGRASQHEARRALERLRASVLAWSESQPSGEQP